MDLAAWQNFAVASVGICGALAGLIFVGISLNLDMVLEHGHLTARGATALATFVCTALLNLCLLVPGTTRTALTCEAVVLAALVTTMAVQTCRVTLRRRREGDPLMWAYQPLAINLVPPVVLVAAAASLVTGHGLDLFAAATFAGIAAAVWEAWVLLIEIRR